jgi:hypothetical protein
MYTYSMHWLDSLRKRVLGRVLPSESVRNYSTRVCMLRCCQAMHLDFVLYFADAKANCEL